MHELMHRPFVTAVPSAMVISAVVLRRYCAASPVMNSRSPSLHSLGRNDGTGAIIPRTVTTTQSPPCRLIASTRPRPGSMLLPVISKMSPWRFSTSARGFARSFSGLVRFDVCGLISLCHLRSRLHRGRPLQASGKPLIHVREARHVDPAHPGPGQHRGNVEVRDRESRAH